MINRKRGDTYVETIERTYDINVNARGDMLLHSLLEERGFDSQTQFLRAFRGKLTTPAKPRRVFLSSHAEDLRQVSGFRLMMKNPHLSFELHDESLREPVHSENSSYIRQVIRSKIERSSIVLCLIGNGTAWRDWVDWELQAGLELRKGLCGVRMKGSRGRTPPLLKEGGFPVATWDMERIISVVECAAARRS